MGAAFLLTVGALIVLVEGALMYPRRSSSPRGAEFPAPRPLLVFVPEQVESERAGPPRFLAPPTPAA